MRGTSLAALHASGAAAPPLHGDFQMIRFPLRAAALAAGALAAALSAQAQSTPTSPGSAGSAAAPGSQRAALARGDRNFIESAAKAGMAEVEMGKMAQGKASNAGVRDFAQRMVSDHTKANEELMSLAATKGVQVPAALDRSHRNQADKLGKLSGAEFDREYVSSQVSDHRKAVAEFKKAADSARDPELKAWAAKTLPTLQQHHKMAETLHDELKGRKTAATQTKS
jgi:putative membrane protein